ncbi:MAG: 4-hydroxybenzoate polyprenyltransferase [Algoriphagus sp.]|jgi:4-hydroxybenzoate polyprenyltransferase
MVKNYNQNNYLVVDLDGTLTKTDLLLESFWSVISSNFFYAILTLFSLFKGRAEFKRKLANKSNIDLSTLPYNKIVIDYIIKWRSLGGKTILVTASDQLIADKIGRHIQLFDEVQGSDGETNLKGTEKAKFLCKRFGSKNFAYMGDSRADFAVWKHASKIIVVNASVRMRKRVDKKFQLVEHLIFPKSKFQIYYKVLRPHQWLKNLLIFIPFLAGHQFTETAIFQSLFAFIAFSMIASGIYIINDLFDLQHDRQNPLKRNRPLASGNINIIVAMGISFLFLSIGMLIASRINTNFFIISLLYFFITIAYSSYFKRLIIIDICLLAIFYTIRLLAGSTASEIPLSFWLTSFSIFFFFSLAAIKRLDELVEINSNGQLKINGRGYHVADLPIISQIASASGLTAVLVMALYLNSEEVIVLYSFPEALWGICLILLFWTNRFIILANRGEIHGDPIVFALKDRVSLFSGLITLFLILIANYYYA